MCNANGTMCATQTGQCVQRKRGNNVLAGRELKQRVKLVVADIVIITVVVRIRRVGSIIIPSPGTVKEPKPWKLFGHGSSVLFSDCPTGVLRPREGGMMEQGIARKG
jgi:hypothetical protein